MGDKYSYWIKHVKPILWIHHLLRLEPPSKLPLKKVYSLVGEFF